MLEHSCEYASSIIAYDTPGTGGCFGARRPEKRDTARSKPPQKKCTGLTLPMNRPRKSLSTLSEQTSVCQKRCAASASYDLCTRSASNRIGFGTSDGKVLMC